MKLKYALVAIVVLALLGIADSAYALKEHYAAPLTSSCDINETVSCTAVNQSSYSDVAGIPVAAIGVAGYSLLAFLAGALVSNRRPVRLWRTLLLLASLAALAVSMALTYVELFVLSVVCPLCVTSLALVVLIASLTLFAMTKSLSQ